MEINKRIIGYIAVCYMVISILLFSIFIYSYRFYFYKNQRETVRIINTSKEKLFLMTVVSKIKSHYRTRESEKEFAFAELKREAKVRLSMMSESLKLISEEKNEKPEPITQEIDDPDFIFDSMPETEKTITKILKPLNKKDSEGLFIQMFDKLNNTLDNKIKIQKFIKGELSQPIPISYIMLGENDLELYNDGFEYKWKIKGFGEIPKIEKVDFLKISDEIKVLDPLRSKRLVIYEANNSNSVYSGEGKVIEFDKIERVVEKAINKPQEVYHTEYFESEVVHDDQRMAKLRVHSVLIEPELKLTLALSSDIYETDWKQYSFFQRNIYPISVYVILAWVVCPIFAWFALAMGNRFKFHYTVDLESENSGKTPNITDELEKDLSTPKTQSFLTSPFPDYDEEDTEKQSDNPVRQTITAQLTQVPFDAEKNKNLKKGNGSASNVDKMPLYENFTGKELEKIRENNIQKAKGVFIPSEDSDEQDYLQGVKSDVLKSLISKMREGE